MGIQNSAIEQRRKQYIETRKLKEVEHSQHWHAKESSVDINTGQYNWTIEIFLRYVVLYILRFPTQLI